MLAAPHGKPLPDAAATTSQMPARPAAWPRFVARFVLGAVGVLVLIGIVGQLVPYGRAHSNPPVAQEPAWDTAQTRALFARACADCHSNQTDWSRYSSVAPLSWVTQWGVDEGRAAFNVSEWPSGGRAAGDVTGSVQKGRMPPQMYLVLRPEARLAPGEQQALIEGLQATFGPEGAARGQAGR